MEIDRIENIISLGGMVYCMGELEKFKMNMKFYRERRGWSQAELAEKVSVSRTVITKLETGEQEPDLSYLLALSKLFEVSIDHLIGKDTSTTEILFEVYGEYETKDSLSEVVDHLVKNPKLTTSLHQLLLVKTRDRRLIEEMLVTIIGKTSRLAER